jgi:hypothetical protein
MVVERWECAEVDVGAVVGSEPVNTDDDVEDCMDDEIEVAFEKPGLGGRCETAVFADSIDEVGWIGDSETGCAFGTSAGANATTKSGWVVFDCGVIIRLGSEPMVGEAEGTG